jgi:hypothetical protein
MAAPNLLSPTTVNAKATGISPANTGETTFLTNAANSNMFMRINALYAANIDGTNNVDCTIKWYSSATSGIGSGFAIANTVTIPADATVVIIGHDAPMYLEENRRITVQASAANDLTITCCYEEVS